MIHLLATILATVSVIMMMMMTPYLAWCDGFVKRIANANTRMVEIKSNEQKVMKGNPLMTRQKLLIRS